MRQKHLLGLASLLTLTLGVFSQPVDLFYGKQIIVTPFAANTSQSDFGVAFVDDQLFYNKVVPGDNEKEQYYRVFAVEIDESGHIAGDPIQQFSAVHHEGPMSYCEATGQLFLTQSNRNDKEEKMGFFKERRFRLTIAVYERDGQNWRFIQEFPYNSTEYSVGHPAVNATGDTLVFASDMPGGQGSTDLYYSAKVNGEWTDPVNMGEQINTPGQEMFPFLDAAGNLIFSSDGHQGKGGLDLFQSRLGTKAGVVALGDRFNTVADDFGLIFDPPKGLGYFCSNREGGNGDDDIYQFTTKRYQQNLIAVSNHTKEILPDVFINVKDNQGKNMVQGKTDQQGQFSFDCLPGQEYQVMVNFPNYKESIYSVEADLADGALVVDKTISMEPLFRFEGLVLNAEQKSPLAGANVMVEQDGQSVETLQTDDAGKFSLSIDPASNYSFKVTALDFMPVTTELITADMKVGTSQQKIELYPIQKGVRIEMKNIYYDLGKYDIKAEAAKELDYLVSVMNENPEMRIRIESHTDSRGSNLFNMDLSQKRAKTIFDYLRTQGIDEDRLTYEGYGETQLVNKCADGIECPEEEHALNRRTVIEIL